MEGVTTLFLPVIVISRYIGHCPIGDRKFARECGTCSFEGIHYETGSFRIKCGCLLFFLLTLIVATVGTLGVYVPPGSMWPDYSQIAEENKKFDALSLFFLSSFEVLYAIQVVLEYIIYWCSNQSLVNWLNGWNDLELLQMQTFGISTDSDANIKAIAGFRNLAIFWLACVPAVLFGSILVFSHNIWNYPLTLLFQILYLYPPTFFIGMGDVRTVLIFRLLQDAVKKIREEIISISSIGTKEGNTSIFYNNLPVFIKVEQIRQWTKLLVKVRKQATSAGEYLGTHQLLTLSVLLYYSAAAIFVAAKIIGEGVSEGAAELAIVLLFTVMSLTRVCAKVAFAVRITCEEKLLAEAITEMELDEPNTTCRMELHALANMLRINPTSISLNDVVVINNRLLLLTFGQVFSLFVVFMQFQSSSLLSVPCSNANQNQQ